MPADDRHYEAARQAIQKVFTNTTVGPDETRRSLNALRDEIDTLIETLPEDDE